MPNPKVTSPNKQPRHEAFQAYPRKRRALPNSEALRRCCRLRTRIGSPLASEVRTTTLLGQRETRREETLQSVVLGWRPLSEAPR